MKGLQTGPEINEGWIVELVKKAMICLALATPTMAGMQDSPDVINSNPRAPLHFEFAPLLDISPKYTPAIPYEVDRDCKAYLHETQQCTNLCGDRGQGVLSCTVKTASDGRMAMNCKCGETSLQV